MTFLESLLHVLRPRPLAPPTSAEERHAAEQLLRRVSRRVNAVQSNVAGWERRQSDRERLRDLD